MRIGDDMLIQSMTSVQPTRSRFDVTVTDDAQNKAPEAVFKNIFQDSWNAYEEASAVSREMTTQLMTGQLDDLPGFVLANQRSGILFDLNLTMRTKVLDAYSEIMKTQV